MTLEPVTKVATSTVDALKSQPLSLALIVVNVLFLVAGGLFVSYLGSAIAKERAANTALIKQLIETCRRNS